VRLKVGLGKISTMSCQAGFGRRTQLVDCRRTPGVGGVVGDDLDDQLCRPAELGNADRQPCAVVLV
jgi:hypothetical protein